MRPIDGDALIAWIKESQHQTTKMKNVICRIESMPSVPSADTRREAFKEGFSEGMLYERRFAKVPQGEWIDAEIPLESGGSMPIQACNLCKTFYPLAYTGGGHRFCPNCGARMKGADDECD